MVLSAWADKIQFSAGMRDFILKGDSRLTEVGVGQE